ncbi:MAG: efflux RND transporter periplasmic adaptor subunit [Thermoanaerobaculia bacterium]|nr:efflux RND transporter periplasmic adaptor subunit [Thermoanaerobaculia bacterium]
MSRFFHRSILIAALMVLASVAAFGQGERGPTPVQYTEAIQEKIRSTARVTGTVESKIRSNVASELSGLVTSLEAREGDFVRKGAPLVRLRSDNVALRLRAAEGELREARARLALAEESRRRAERLFDDEVISQQQLDDAVGESEAWLGRVSQLEADVARLRNDLARMVVRAPFSGVVTEEKTAIGSWISAGGDVAEMVDTVNLEVTVNVPERYFAGLETGSPVTIRIPSVGGIEIEGTVAAIIPAANRQARTFPVKIRFRNPDERVGIGMLAEARLPVGAPQQGTLVPKDAIVRQGGSTGVWIVGTDQIIQWVEVDTGTSAGVWIEVSGVRPGSRVITRGNERLRPGQTVNPSPLEYPQP